MTERKQWKKVVNNLFFFCDGTIPFSAHPTNNTYFDTTGYTVVQLYISAVPVPPKYIRRRDLIQCFKEGTKYFFI